MPAVVGARAQIWPGHEEAKRARDAVFPQPPPPPPLSKPPPPRSRIGLYHSISHHSLSHAFRNVAAANASTSHLRSTSDTLPHSPRARSHSPDGCQHHKHYCRPRDASPSSVSLSTSTSETRTRSDSTESFPTRSRSSSRSVSGRDSPLVFEHPRGRSLERELGLSPSYDSSSLACEDAVTPSQPEMRYGFLTREYSPPRRGRRTRLQRAHSRSLSLVSVCSRLDRRSEPAELLTYSFEGNMAYVPAGRTYDEAIEYAVEAFPVLRPRVRSDISLHVTGPDQHRVRVPRVAWAELLVDLPKYEIVYVEVVNMDDDAPPSYDAKGKVEWDKAGGRKEERHGLGGWVKGLFHHHHA